MRIADGTETFEPFNLEHLVREVDNPWRTKDAQNLTLTDAPQNQQVLEGLREHGSIWSKMDVVEAFVVRYQLNNEGINFARHTLEEHRRRAGTPGHAGPRTHSAQARRQVARPHAAHVGFAQELQSWPPPVTTSARLATTPLTAGDYREALVPHAGLRCETRSSESR